MRICIEHGNTFRGSSLEGVVAILGRHVHDHGILRMFFCLMALPLIETRSFNVYTSLKSLKNVTYHFKTTCIYLKLKVIK